MSTAPPTPATRGELATLWVDEPAAPFNVAVLCRFGAGPFARPDGRPDLERVREELWRRAAAVPTLRRKLTDTPHPAWVDDASLSEEHIRCAVMPDGSELLDWCADRIGRALPRERPLWAADVVGLPEGGFALLFIAHHVFADGRRGVAILRALLDHRTEAPDPPVAPAPRGATAPPVRGRRWRQLRDAVRDLGGRAPVTSLSRPVGPGRRIVVVSAPLDAVRAAGAPVGATVNDVLLAAVTAGLRALLISRGDDVAGLTLRASMPVSSGSAGQPEGLLLVPLPVGEADPVRRLTAIAATTGALKGRLRTGGGNVFDVLHLPTPLARAAVRWMRRVAARAINLFVTDVPGPTEPLSLAGAPLLSAVPVAPLAAGVPLGIAALSYAGTLSVAVNAATFLTDLGVLRDAMDREFATLATAGSDRADPTRSEAPT